MENSYTKWLENQEEKQERDNDASINDLKIAMNGYSKERINAFSKDIVKAVYNESNYYDSYEKVEKMLENFLSK